MPSFSSLPGFRDFYPPELSVRTHITNAWREAARRYGFEEYDGPPLESLDLYTEKSGDEIVGQLYNFEDKGGRAVALRPEMTPTFARMVGARAAGMKKPIRWFSIPQLFRYERTQRGRLREHFQWNVDIVGEEDVSADAEVLAVALAGLRLLGLTERDIVARVNDRRLLEQLLRHLGVAAERLSSAYAVIDKIGRDTDAKTRERLRSEAGLSASALDDVMAIFQQTSLDQLASQYANVPAVASEVARLHSYFAQLDELGARDFVTFDPGIVRGLAYYTGIVFEIFDRQGELRAICGGELLADRGLLAAYQPSVDYYIIAVSEAERSAQMRLARRLRGAGHSVAYGFKAAALGKQFKDADARGARVTIVIGPDELKAGMAVVKDMSSGTETREKLEAIGIENG
jgi:histidyl-tRNA synthetase